MGFAGINLAIRVYVIDLVLVTLIYPISQDGDVVHEPVLCCPSCTDDPRPLGGPFARYLLPVPSNNPEGVDIPITGVIISATWVPGTGCSVTKTNTSMLMVSFTYTACFVFVLLVFALVKLVYLAPKRPRISTLIYYEGLQYYIIA